MDPNEEMARLRAEMDQAVEGIRETARGLWTFYSECHEQGFDPDQAFALTATFLVEMWRGANE
jgi:hypothetical protein